VTLRESTVDEVIARIAEAARAAPGGAIAFDGDGTLWSGDVGEDFFGAVIASGRITPRARGALAPDAREHGVSDDGSGEQIALRIHRAYLAGAFPEERVCEIMTWVVAGWTFGEVSGFCRELVTKVALADRLHPESLAVVRWADARGIPVHLVSASPRSIVLAAAAVVPVDPSRVVAAQEARTEKEEDRVDAAVVRPIPYGPGKVTRLREQLGDRPLYAAFGDNAFDAPMLREAAVRVAVRPKPRLLERASEIPDLVALRRL
jgi:phosphoserine phosphatase